MTAELLKQAKILFYYNLEETKMKTRKILALLLAVVLLFSLAACGNKSDDTTTASVAPTAPTAVNANVNIAMLKGPTGIGAAKLMSDKDAGKALNNYNFTLSADPQEVLAGVVKGDFDIAACPLNVASVLYNKTQGNIQMLAINTLGTLYILSSDPAVTSIKDLAGKTVIAAGQGGTPEYVLDYLLEKNGVKGQVNVEFKSEHSEVATLATTGEASIVLLPEPNVTAVTMKNQNMKIAVDLSKEFETASGVSLAMGCVVARKDFVENNKAAVEAFMYEYEKSVAYVNDDVAATSTLCETYGIIPKAAVAQKAIPNCSIKFVKGADMKTVATENLTVLFNANAKSVGGKLPADDFWYGV